MKRKLAKEALFSTHSYELHRSHRRSKQFALGGSDPEHDVTDPDAMWDVTAEQIQKVDPGGYRARALLIQFTKK